MTTTRRHVSGVVPGPSPQPLNRTLVPHMALLTPQRLIHLSLNPVLAPYWPLVAACTLTVCNRPLEVPVVYHYWMLTNALAGRVPLEQEAQAAIDSAQRYRELAAGGEALPPFPTTHTSASQQLAQLTQLREALLKLAALIGLPRVINALMDLKNATPVLLRSETLLRPLEASPTQVEEERARGRAYWDKVYSKISGRVRSQMHLLYPDLWTYAIDHVYSPLLSHTGVLDPVALGMVIIACLVPQDVNPQLKGHLRGAHNNGCTHEQIAAARQLSVDISRWCNVLWREEVAKL